MFGRRKPEDALDAELRFHLEQQIEKYLALGMSAEDARRQARLDFGGLDQVKESCRDVRTSRYFTDFLQDLRFGCRMLKKSWRTAVISIAVIAIGVGANIAAFSIADAFLLRPLRLPAIESAVRILGTDKTHSQPVEEFAAADFLALQGASRSLENIAAWSLFLGNISGGSGPEEASGMAVSANFFEVFGIQPAAGRFLDAGDGQETSAPVAVISYALWDRQYRSRPEAVGAIIRVQGRDYRIAGVAPKAFRYIPEAEVWIPLILTPQDRADRSKTSLKLVARLGKGVTIRQADAELATLSGRLPSAAAGSSSGRVARVVPLLAHFAPDDDEDAYIYLVWAAALLVLGVTIANVANLQYSRATLREREMAIRTALGAGRFRLVRQLLTESALLGMTGCVAGAWVAIETVSLMRSSLPASLVRYVQGWDYFSVNPRALVYGLAAAALAGLLAGIAPALSVSSIRPSEQLKASGPGASAGPSRHRLRNILVVIQVSLSVVLLVGAAVVIAGFRQLAEPLPGTDPDSALTLRMILAESDYRGPQQLREFQLKFLDAIQALPGIKTAALVSDLPYSGMANGDAFFVEGRPVTPGVQLPSAILQSASPAYFQAMHIPIVKGRRLEVTDRADSTPVGVVSEALAREAFPGEDPLSRRIKLFSFSPTAKEPWITIVGVAKDVQGQPAPSALYRPYEQAPPRFFDMVVRSSVPPLEVAKPVLAKLKEINPSQPAYDVRTLREVYDNQVLPLRWVADLVSLLGLFALILAAMGVFGVVSNAALERKKEVAIRMAFGARAQTVTWMVLKHGFALAAAGAVLGMGVGAVLSRILAASMPEVHAASLWTCIAAGSFLAAGAVPACYFPARRAAMGNPAETLRTE